MLNLNLKRRIQKSAFLLNLTIQALLNSKATSTKSGFMANVYGGTGSVIGKILGLVVGGYLAGSTLPDTITLLSNATLWANTPAVVQTLGGTVCGIIIIVAFIFLLLKEAGISD